MDWSNLLGVAALVPRGTFVQGAMDPSLSGGEVRAAKKDIRKFLSEEASPITMSIRNMVGRYPVSGMGGKIMSQKTGTTDNNKFLLSSMTSKAA